MTRQNFKNHIRFYTPHHFVFYPVMLAFLVVSVYFSCTSVHLAIWAFVSGLTVSVILLSFMLRQHYALVLQNRVVVLELEFRYFVVTGNRLELLHLADSQLFALRFAPDDELPALAQRAASEKLDANAIKKSILNWRPDYKRV